MTEEKTRTLTELREGIEKINLELLNLLNKRSTLVRDIRKIKEARLMPLHDPARESEQIDKLLLANRGPLSATTMKHLFKEIFLASLHQMEKEKRGDLLVHSQSNNPEVMVGDVPVGGGEPIFIVGPCTVESEEMMEEVAAFIAPLGVRLLRGGAYKPRTSPYSFQGLGPEGLKIMRRVADKHGLKVVTEIMDPGDLDIFSSTVDLIQVGARNMYNTTMLKKLGESNRPILLKRAFSATIKEFLLAAEYLYSHGNQRVILCERGIRTFETSTRNTLDIAAVPILKGETNLPVIVDISHAAGRRDILLPMARAALAAGADGIMIEVHPSPQQALSDGQQQLDLPQFSQFLKALTP